MADQAESLREAFNNFNNKLKAGTNIITIASGKGGVGKSIFAVNLGLALSSSGKKVTILDADFGLANVNVILGVLPKYNLYDVLKNGKNLSDILIEVEDNFYIIAGVSGAYQLTNLSQNDYKKLLKQFETLDDNDYIIIDAGAGISENVLRMIYSANQSIILTTPEPTAIADAYGIIKAIALYDNKDKLNLNLVVNRVKTITEAKIVANRIISIVNQFLNIKINYLGFIFDDPVVPRSVMQQTPFVFSYPNSKASSSIFNIANILTKNYSTAEKNSIINFFKKLFRFDKDNSTDSYLLIEED